jgi:hypothetical protein
MKDDKLIHSHSVQLPVSAIRNLKIMAKELDLMLNHTEYLRIVSVYNECIDRLLKENGEE